MSVIQAASAVIKSVQQLPRRLFGSRNDRQLKVYHRRLDSINAGEAELRENFDQRYEKRLGEARVEEAPEEERDGLRAALRLELSEDLLQATVRLREEVGAVMQPLHDWWNALEPKQHDEEHFRTEFRNRNTKLLDVLDERGLSTEAFSVLREASRRAQNHRHFDCQLIGGRVLFDGKIAEMKTGEGKTIVCHLAAYLNHLCGRKVHVITVNDYLVRRDAEFAMPIFELVGVSVGFIQSQLDPGGREGVRQAAYACDVTYGTNSEFGFDYLRDNMKSQLEEQVQGRLDYVIVDEVDSILIDEARTPLIISGPAHDDVTRYPRANQVAEELVRQQAVWDRKVVATVRKYDGDSKNIPKLQDAMNILGYKEKKGGKKDGKKDAAPKAEESSETRDAAAESTATLGPEFLTDDHVEAIQIYEHDVLGMSASERYRRFFIVQIERKQAGLTHEGVTIAQDQLDIGSLYGGANMEWPHLIENALRAFKVYQRDKDYVVQGGEIVIVDPFTGRLMIGRQWSDGLHQAIEAKERVVVKEETQTLATITIQNFVKLYMLRAGMTGTALTEGAEFDKIYKLDVMEVPTNRPVNRVDYNDKMYQDTDQKYAAIVDEIHDVHRRGRPADPFLIADALIALEPIMKQQGRDTSPVTEAIRQFNDAEIGDVKVISFMLDTYDEAMGDLIQGRPVLVGTTSVENSEKLAELLTQRYGIDHEVLNAKNHAREAEIVAKAGFTSPPPKGADKRPLGNVTIATNMAGRGTDIKLGPGVVYEKCKVPETMPEGLIAMPLYPTGVTKCCIHCEEYDPATNCAHCFKPKIDSRFPELGRKVCPIGVPCGLHIIGTERHEARRIDNQLRGRAGRQGDPGSSRFSLSLQDELLKLFMPDWMLKMMEKLGFSDGASLEDKRLTKGIERAQRKVEERNFSTRKNLLEWDEPMDFQRKEFYAARQRILEERDLPDLIFDTIDNAIRSTVAQHLGGMYVQTCVAEWCHTKLDLAIAPSAIDPDDLDTVKDAILRRAKDEVWDQIRTSIGEYIDPEEPPEKWDVGGLVQWGRKAFGFSLTQNQMRKMEPRDIEDALTDAANAHYDALDLDAVAVYLVPDYPHHALAEWARTKFDLDVDSQQLLERSQEEIATLLRDGVRQAYQRREVSFPIDWCLDHAFSREGADPATAGKDVVDWANRKYNAGWTIENVEGKTADAIREELTVLGEACLNGGLEREIEEHVAKGNPEEVCAWAKERFGAAWNPDRAAAANGDLKEVLLKQGREMLRWELTRLEQFVLLRLYDQAWKDHLLEMDHLKTAIMQRPLGGDQSHPQSQFAIEGRELFGQMWVRIADRVTQMIFKVKMVSGAAEERTEGRRQPSAMSFGHADATGTGFGGQTADQEAAMRAQDGEGKVETIRRDKPKVGRNEPCPCGSGKKFKQCHGRGQ